MSGVLLLLFAGLTLAGALRSELGVLRMLEMTAFFAAVLTSITGFSQISGVILLRSAGFSASGWMLVSGVLNYLLSLLMGIGLALVLRRVGTERKTAFVLWCVQLALNAAWSLLFFGAGAYLGALICLCLLWVSIFLMMMVFDSASPAAALLQVPYFLWVSYAGYLNLVIWRLNP